MERLHILLVEDNPLDVRLLREALKGLNGQQPKLTHVPTLAESLESLKAIRFDVVLLDLSLPDSDGFDTLVQLRMSTEETPIVVLTGHDDEEFAARSLQLGAQDYLVKGRTDGQLILRSIRYAVERSRTYQILKQSMEQYRLLAENITDVIWTMDFEFRRIYTSPSVYRLRGYTPEEAANQPLEDTLTPESYRYVTTALHDVITAEKAGAMDVKKIHTVDLELKCKDGSTVWTEVRISILHDSDNKPIGFLGVTRDISERKRAEDALKTTSSQLKNLFDNLDYVFMSLDIQRMQVLQVSPACEKVYGLPRQVFLNQPDLPLDVIHPDDKPGILAAIKGAYDGKTISLEHRIIRPDGEVRWVEASIKPALDAQSNLVRIDVVVSDITQRKQVEKMQSVLVRILDSTTMTDKLEDFLVSLRLYLGDLIDTTNFYVALYDAERDMYSFPIFEDQYDSFGLNRIRLPNTLIDYVRRTGNAQLVDEEMFLKMESQGLVERLGTMARIWLGVPLKTVHGVIGVMAVQSYNDRTHFTWRDLQLLSLISGHVAMAIERKRALDALLESEEQLRQAQKMEAVGRLAGGVAHDFNNLLTAILGHSELALYKLHDGDPLRDSVEQIMKAAERAASLTRQLLAFSRKQVLQPRLLDLNSTVTDMEKMLRRLIGEDIVLVTKLDSQLGVIKADPGQIEQVIMNLAVNARDAMPQGGRLCIETAEVELDESYSWSHTAVAPGRYVMLAVSDNGVGMDAETRSHIFEPFFTTKEIGKGTGLGLSTVYGIVNQSGGHIWVYSEPGQGTTFKIYLPRATGEAVKLERPITPLSQNGHETILLVEDEEGVRELVRRILEQKGYHIIATSDARNALRIAQDYDGYIHLLITDVIMPHISGDILAHDLAALRPEIRILFMSGYTDDSMNNRNLDRNGAAFLPKPFSADHLARKVRELLDASSVAA
ncbi:MAG: response regulator [Calditrichota bacterium]